MHVSSGSSFAPARKTKPFETLESRRLLSAVAGVVAHHHVAPAHQHQQHQPLHHQSLRGQHAQPNLKVLSEAANFSPAATSGPVAYSPWQIRHAYGFDQVANYGLGQTIAIVDAYRDTHIAADLNTFDSTWGLPAASLRSVLMNSSTGSDAGWGLETALDVEWAHAVAPNAKLLLVQARSSSLGDLLSAVDYAKNQAGVSVVSMSWGGGEFWGEWNYDYHFSKSNVTFVASAGDTGGVQSWPAESPSVLSVGGTSLPLDSNGNRTGAETAWTSGGGGFSSYYGEPNYQYWVQNTGVRTNPDVAYNADPNTGYYVYDSNYYGTAGWFDVGGTSAGAPQWAGLIALADQQRAAAGKATLGTSQTLAALYNPYQVPTWHYNDIVSGSAGNNAATPGYDLATGQGSPFSNEVIADLAAV